MKKVYLIDKSSLGAGSAPPFFAWQPVLSSYLAIVGASSYALRVIDRQGSVVDMINLTSSCSGLVWSPDGSTLGILQSQASNVILWKAKNQSELLIETTFKMFTCMAWSQNSEMIAVGTSKGNLLLVILGSKTTPILGKHTKAILYVFWTKEDLVITVSEDKTLATSNLDGDTLFQFALRGHPSSPSLYRSLNQMVAFICLLDKKSIYLHSMSQPTASPNLLTLPPKYGEILAIYPLESQQELFVVCANGQISMISLDPNHLGQERAVSKVFKTGIYTSALMNQKVAFANESHIKTLEITDLREVVDKFEVIVTPNIQVDSMAWSEDTRFLTLTIGGFWISTPTSGDVITYAAAGSTLALCNGEITAFVSGLTEVTVGSEILIVPSEPLHMTINLEYLVIGVQNEVQIYSMNPLKLSMTIPFTAPMEQLCLTPNDLCVLSAKNLHCFSLRNTSATKVQIENVHQVSYYGSFVVTLSGNTITYYDGTPLDPISIHAKIQLELPVTQWFQSPFCASAVLVSDAQCFLTNPARDHLISFPCKASQFLWDAFHPNLFYAYTSDTFFCFIYLPYTLADTPMVHLVSQTNLPTGWVPLYATEGQVTCIAEQKINTMPYYDPKNFLHLYFLNLHATLFQKVVVTSTHPEIPTVMEYALRALDLSFVHDLLLFSGDLANSMYFQICACDEELNLRRGHVLTWYQDYAGAQEMYLNCSQPIHALLLRKDLLQWEQALTLANKTAVEEEPKVCEAYAKQLESDGRYFDALIMYQKALDITPSLSFSRNGVAKMKLRMGDFKFIEWILQQDDTSLLLESSKILEELKEYTHAGRIYEKAKEFEKAAVNYFLDKQWHKIDSILPQIQNPKVLSAYAEYLESQELYEKALQCYEKAKDVLGMTKIFLCMSRIDEAVTVARLSKSQDAAKMVAQFLTQLGDLSTVLEFYLLAGAHQQAWHIAKDHDMVRQYIAFLGTSVTKEQLLEAAQYFENTSPFQAGQYYLEAEVYDAALSHFLTHPDGIMDAIETVGRAKQDYLTHSLINFLMGIKGPEKARYIFLLYMKLGQYPEAMQTALGIARDEWNKGNYRSARDILFETLQQLRNAKQHVAGHLMRMIFLLHSYMLVKPLLKLGEHVNCALMLTRVSKNISRFQTHVIPILTSTVLECSKTGLNELAHDFATQLMRPEYRTQIDPKYKKRIENIVRNHVAPDVPKIEATSPCPHCQSPLPITETECNQCQNMIPFCIASGYHMTLENWSQCPQCTFPALLPALRKFAEANMGCPLCNGTLLTESVKLVENPQFFLSSWKYDNDLMSQTADS